MKKIILLLVVILLTAGCVKAPASEMEDAENASQVENETTSVSVNNNTSTENTTVPAEEVNCAPYYAEYLEHKASGFSEKAAVALTHECVKTYTPLPGTITTTTTTPTATTAPVKAEDKLSTIKDYLADHPIAMFSTLPDRLDSASIESKKAFLEYRTSTQDPGQESVYLSGVALMSIPEISQVNVTGYNSDNKAIQSSQKEFNRTKYNFKSYSLWFPDYVAEECNVDADCVDNDACTTDQCIGNMCSNVCRVVGNCSCL